MLIAAISVSVLGLLLTFRALYPRRVGETRYCRKCRYNLTGLDLATPGARCPECGSVLGEKHILVGERRRRASRVLISLVILLAGALPLTAIVVGGLWANAYGYFPTGLLLTLARHGDPQTVSGCFKELSLRFVASSLSADQIAAVAEAALTREAGATKRDQAGEAIVLLHRLYTGNQLAREQTQRFLANLLRQPRLRVRSMVICGQEFYLGAPFENWVPGDAFSVAARIGGVRFGGKPAEVVDRGVFPGGTELYTYGTLTQAGLTLVEMNIVVELSDRASNTLLCRAIRTATGSVRVLAEEPPDYIRLVCSEKLDLAVTACARATEFWDFGQSLSGTIRFQTPLPTGLAFDAFTEIDGRMLELGEVVPWRDSDLGTRKCALAAATPVSPLAAWPSSCAAARRLLPEPRTLLKCGTASCASRKST
jgi:hypothetical protein